MCTLHGNGSIVRPSIFALLFRFALIVACTVTLALAFTFALVLAFTRFGPFGNLNNVDRRVNLVHDADVDVQLDRRNVYSLELDTLSRATAAPSHCAAAAT